MKPGHIGVMNLGHIRDTECARAVESYMGYKGCYEGSLKSKQKTGQKR